jgi:hypothetical protein
MTNHFFGGGRLRGGRNDQLWNQRGRIAERRVVVFCVWNMPCATRITWTFA